MTRVSVNRMGLIGGILGVTVLIFATIPHTDAHGMVLSPVSRGSRWRYDSSAPINYDDNGNFCGGFYVQHSLNGGKCGLCGDNYALSTPRPHELGGKFGQGVVVQNYKPGSILPVSIKITANHQGFFYFNLCDLKSFGGESEECFAKYPLRTTTGQLQYKLGSNLPGQFNVTLQLPSTLTRCDRCVLQWTYNVGNSWGVCEDGTGRLGCGIQENFRTCSDISIGN